MKIATFAGVLALVLPGAALADIINSPVPTNAYITYDGLDWAWGGPCPYSGGCYATGDLTYQSTQGWALPSQVDLAIVDSVDAVNPAAFADMFLGNGGNVPAGGGSDPVSGAFFTGSVGQAAGGSCATPYFSGAATWCDDGDGRQGLWAGSLIAAESGEQNFAEQLYVKPVSAAPEPTIWALMLVGMGGIGLALRRRLGGLAAATGAAG